MTASGAAIVAKIDSKGELSGMSTDERRASIKVGLIKARGKDLDTGGLQQGPQGARHSRVRLSAENTVALVEFAFREVEAGDAKKARRAGRSFESSRSAPASTIPAGSRSAPRPDDKLPRSNSISTRSGHPRPTGKTLPARAAEAAGAVAPELGHEHLLVSLVMADDEEVHALNRQWRAEDKPTNVLSFPMLAREEVLAAAAVPGAPGMLGDLILAHGVCTREAAGEGHRGRGACRASHRPRPAPSGRLRPRDRRG
jgi:rRNA maturation RNase YbeY